MVSFTGLSPKQAQSIEVLKNHISLPDVEVAVSQSDQASISIKGEKGQYQLTYRKPPQSLPYPLLLKLLPAQTRHGRVDEVYGRSVDTAPSHP